MVREESRCVIHHLAHVPWWRPARRTRIDSPQNFDCEPTSTSLLATRTAASRFQ